MTTRLNIPRNIAHTNAGLVPEVIFLIFEENIERRERPVAAGDVLLQIKLVRVA